MAQSSYVTLPGLLILLSLSGGGTAANFPSSQDKVPPGWKGPVFRLSQTYPSKLPQPEPLPWAAIDPVQQPKQYAQAVYAYVLEGNVEAGWKVQNNKVRKWYHVPWMHYGDSGREFIHGMTRERTAPAPATPGKGELGPQQTRCFQNWAVGFYNPAGGYQVGRIWKKATQPNATLAQFPEGTVVAKLLFTTAPDSEVPYLKNTFEWDGNIHVFGGKTCPSGALPRKPQKVRLLQLDMAVKDSRVPVTGWLFATLAYNGDAPGATPWERMKLVGAMWGNDLAQPQQWINTAIGTPQHLGAEGRLNGPVDNPRSSCISCHATAQTPMNSPMIPPSAADAPRWFTNYPGSQAFDPGSLPTDYSLQVSMGIQNLLRSQAAKAGPGKIAPEEMKLLQRAFDSGIDQPLPVTIKGTMEYPGGR